MKAFDPGGAPHAHDGGQRMSLHRHSQTTPSCEFTSAQRCARRKLFCSKGLKEGIFSEDAEKRVLHSTCRATHYLMATIVSLEDPSKRVHFHPMLRNAEQSIHSRTNINTSDGSVCNRDHVAGRMEEGQGFLLVDAFTRGQNKVKTTVGCGDVQPEQENSGHVATSFDSSLLLSSLPEASYLFSNTSSTNSYKSACANFTSSQGVNIPKALVLHISCHEVRRPCSTNESCIKDPEVPSTPHLQPEMRSWDCDVLCTKGAEYMLPANNLFLEKKEIVSTCIVQCSMVPTNCFDALMQQGNDACVDHCFLSGPTYTFCDHWESANSRHPFQKSNSSPCRQYMFQRLPYLKISVLSTCAAPNKKKLHVQTLHTLQFRLALLKLVRLLKQKMLNWEGEVMCELFADIQFYLQDCKPRLIPDQGQRAIEASTAAYFSRRLECKQVHSRDKAYARSFGPNKKVNMEMISQEQVRDMLQVFSQKYFARKSGHCLLPLNRLSLEHDNRGIYKTKQCSSMLSSKVGINSASKLPKSLKINDRGLPMSTELLSELVGDLKEDFMESHGSPSWKSAEQVDDWNSIPIDQVGECLDTCLSHLQPRASSFPFDLTLYSKLLDVAVRRTPAESSSIKYSDGYKINEVSQDDLLYIQDNRSEASCLPISAADGPHSHTPSQCISSLSFNREEPRSSILHGGVLERQSKEKLEHYAEGFLLRRHIMKQQRRAQQAPPFPPGDSGWLAIDDEGTSRRLLADVRTNPYTCLSKKASIESSENKNHELTMILTSSLTKPRDVTSSFGDDDGFVGADLVIDIVGLIEFIESHSSQLDTFTDVASNSINHTHMPLIGGQSVIPNVSVVIVTIVAIVVYTKILLEGALAWVGARQTQSEEEN